MNMTRLIEKIYFFSEKMFPKIIHQNLIKVYFSIMKQYYKIFGRKYREAETTKARKRRKNEKFFEKYCVGKGLDVGYGGDLVTNNATGWDFEDGNAQYLERIDDNSFDFVYTSHVIEHMVDPSISLKNWWRVLKKEGHLILYLPHRDLYEKKKTLPSRWNPDHKHFFLEENHEKPDTLGLRQLLSESIKNYEVIYIKKCDQGNTITDPHIHSDGEYSIEAVIKK